MIRLSYQIARYYIPKTIKTVRYWCEDRGRDEGKSIDGLKTDPYTYMNVLC